MSHSRKRNSFSMEDEEGNDVPVIKAMVTENNGEISCSVEETNRIRALLGLKPLRIDKPNEEAKAVQNFKEKTEEQARTIAASELQKKIEKAKEKRLLHAKLEGETLGEISNPGEAELLSAADWVKRSRKKEISAKEKAKLEAELAAKRLDEEENELLQNISKSKYSQEHLKGVQVMHGTNDFEIGQEVILTLADSSVLDTDDQGRVLGINEAGDVLENVNLAESDRRMEREARAKRLKQPVYAAYDDAEFAPGVQPGSKLSILAQYDAEVKAGPKLVLAEGGKAIDIDQQPILQDEKRPVAQSLQMEVTEGKDFYTPAEYATFSKPKNREKKRRLRKRVVDEADAAAELAAVLEQTADGGDGAEDRRSRSSVDTKAKLASAAQKEAQQRKQGYEEAERIAAEKTKNHFAFSSSAISQVAAAEDEDDFDMARALAASRRLALLKKRSAEGAIVASSVGDDTGAQKARALLSEVDAVVKGTGMGRTREVGIAESKEVDEMEIEGTDNRKEAGAGLYVSSALARSRVVGGEEELKFDEIDAEGRRTDGTLVFTNTTEFTTRLQARLNEKARSRAEAAVRAAAAAPSARGGAAGGAAAAGGAGVERGWSVIRDPDEPSGSAEGAKQSGRKVRRSTGNDDGEEGDDGEDWKQEMGSDNDDDDDDDDDGGEDDDDGDVFVSKTKKDSSSKGAQPSDLVMQQPLVAKGMAATLALLKGSGELTQREELGGRARDARDIDPSSMEFGVKLEYRDEFGRKLTQKEAFRQMSYKFHGYGPGKKKQEKRLKAIEAKSKAATSRGATEVGTMRSLVRAQEATGKAHVTVQGGGNNLSNSADLAALAKLKAKNAARAASSGSASVVGGASSVVR